MSLAKEALEKGMKEVNEGELKRSPGGFCCIKLAAANSDMKKRDLLLQAGLGGSLHLSPGKFKGCNFYLRTIPMLLVRWRQLCHCTRPLDSS